MMIKSTIRKISVLSILAMVSSPALAHKFNVFAFAEGTTIEGEAYFSGAGKAADIEVQLMLGDTLIDSQQTGSEGEFVFVADKPAAYTLVANAKQGHVAKYTITAEEMGGGEEVEISGKGTTGETLITGGQTGIDNKALQGMVEKAVAKQIRPLREQLNAFQDKRLFQDILGALGYILGLAGLTSLILNRKSNRKRKSS